MGEDPNARNLGLTLELMTPEQEKAAEALTKATDLLREQLSALAREQIAARDQALASMYELGCTLREISAATGYREPDEKGKRQQLEPGQLNHQSVKEILVRLGVYKPGRPGPRPRIAEVVTKPATKPAKKRDAAKTKKA